MPIATGLRLVLFCAALFIVVLSLLTDGANSTTSAAALAAILSIMAAIQVAIGEPAAILRTLKRYRVALAALLVLILLAAAQALTPWGDPTGSKLGVPGPRYSIAPHRALEGIAALFGPVAAFIVAQQARGEKDTRERLALLLQLGGLVFCLGSLGLYVRGLGETGVRLAAGVGANGACTVAMLFALLSLAACQRSLFSRASTGRAADGPVLTRLPPLGLALIVLALVSAVLSQSRAGLVSLGIAMLAELVLFSRGRRAGGWVVSLAALGAMLFALIVLQVVVGRATTASGEDFGSRLALWQAHFGAFLQRPVFGFGLNTFHEINAFIADPGNWAATRSVGSAHNITIQVLEETGVAGLLVWLALLGVPSLRLLRQSRDSSSRAAWACAGFAAMLGVVVHGQFDFGLQIPAVAALLALILGAFDVDRDLERPPVRARMGQRRRSPKLQAPLSDSPPAPV